MSALAWLFALGGAAVALPVLFHLIRRAPRNQQPFSSLMFLEESPPRLTRRSRLDDWLLLLLRCLAIVAIALAFTRPFFRTDGDLLIADEPGRRVAVVVDDSVSMSRDGIAERVAEAIDAVLAELEGRDAAALVTFGRGARVAVPFAGVDGDELAVREAIRDAARELAFDQPASEIDAALIRTVALLAEPSDDGEPAAASAMQIVLISDMQEGGSLDRLQRLDWPAETRLAVRRVAPDDESNASLRPLAIDPADRRDVDRVPIRIANAEASELETFRVQWFGNGESLGDGTVADVAPGSSLVLDLERPSGADAIALVGDAAGFDDVFHLPPSDPIKVAAAVLGEAAADDPESPAFYLMRALDSGEGRSIDWDAEPNDDDADLLLVTAGGDANVAAESVRNGGVAIVVLDSKETASRMQPLIGPVESLSRDQSRGDLLLAELRFDDPLLAPFREPQFSDFTDVRFWRATPVSPTGDDATVIARFDNGWPAIWRQSVGDGAVFVFTSGWQPADSQLGLSNKFVPLALGMLTEALPPPPPPTGYVAGEAIALPDAAISVTLGESDTAESVWDASDGEPFVPRQAGAYRAIDESGETVTELAVNWPAAESRTDPVAAASLGQYGVALGEAAPAAETIETRRRQRDIELEAEQKVWKWLILATLGLLTAEMLLASRRITQQASGDRPV